jgi:hypothetical protein
VAKVLSQQNLLIPAGFVICYWYWLLAYNMHNTDFESAVAMGTVLVVTSFWPSQPNGAMPILTL